MARKRGTVIGVWIAILLYFSVGSSFPKEADLFLNFVYGVLLLAATVFTVAIWVRDKARGEPEKSYHLTAYPRGLLRFVFDEQEPRRETEVKRRPPRQHESDPDET